MIKKLKSICLLVRNYEDAIDFYTTKLGFEVMMDIPYGNNRRWVSLRLPEQNDMEFILGLADSEEGLQMVGKQAHTYPLFVINTDNCQGDFEKLLARGVNFNGAPRIELWGTGVSFDDLYGNKLYLLQEY